MAGGPGGGRGAAQLEAAAQLEVLFLIQTNAKQLITISVIGEISSPGWRHTYRVGYDGIARTLAGSGGIVYDVRVGDSAFGWAGDHVEPGVSIKNRDERANGALNTFACVGNEARVVSGDAKGARGVVTGTHGGIEHVIIDFEPDVLEKLVIGDRIQIRARGQGLAIEGFPGVTVMNTSPELLTAMISKRSEGILQVPVTAKIPPELMGSGIGAQMAERGDYDITTQDGDLIRELGLDRLRLGDIVAVEDRASSHGRWYRRGAVEIGVIVHSDSYQAGHGPGVVSLLTALKGELEPVIDPDANITKYLNIGGGA